MQSDVFDRVREKERLPDEIEARRDECTHETNDCSNNLMTNK